MAVLFRTMAGGNAAVGRIAEAHLVPGFQRGYYGGWPFGLLGILGFPSTSSSEGLLPAEIPPAAFFRLGRAPLVAGALERAPGIG